MSLIDERDDAKAKLKVAVSALEALLNNGPWYEAVAKDVCAGALDEIDVVE